MSSFNICPSSVLYMYNELSLDYMFLKFHNVWLVLLYYPEFEQLKVVNNNIIRGMECLEKERKRLTEELKETKSLNDLQQRNFIEEIKSVSWDEAL